MLLFTFILNYQTRMHVRSCRVKTGELAQTQTLDLHMHVLVHKVLLEITVKHVKYLFFFNKNKNFI